VNVLPDDAPRPRQPTDFPPAGVNSLATFWPRAGARVLDVVIVGVPAVAVIVPFLPSSPHASTPTWLPLPFLVLFGLYEIVLVTVLGRTVGKMAAGIRVAQLVNGRRPDLGQSALRALLPLTLLVIPVLAVAWPLVYLTALFNPMGRGIHDQAGGTVVVRSR
jgi:uncharacterized RDD family membrane protein YckC